MFSNTGPVLTTLALIGCIDRKRARSASMRGMIFKSIGKLRANAVRSKVSSIFASTRRPGSKPGTLSKTTAGGVEILSRIISVSAPISRSQCAPEICSSCSRRLTSFSQSRRSQEYVCSDLIAVAVAMIISPFRLRRNIYSTIFSVLGQKISSGAIRRAVTPCASQ
jgi:hypothetical protein